MSSLTLQLLGTGTSQGIPVIGCGCAVCRSPDPRDKRQRCAALFSDGRTSVLVDCGPDVRQQLLRAGTTHLDAVVITHEHNDHIIGLDDLRPFIFRQGGRPFRIYAEPRVQAEIRQRFAYAFAEQHYPGAPRFELLDARPGEDIHVGTLPPIRPLRVMHGRLPILGYRVAELAYLTDVKTAPAETMHGLRGLSVLVTSALHRYEHHSHMTLLEAQAFAKTVGARATYFIHMSHLAPPHAELEAALGAGVNVGYDGLRVIARSQASGLARGGE